MNAKDEISKIVEFLLYRSSYFNVTQLQGCSRKTVDSFNKYATCGRLPSLYRQFLLAMGKRIAGRYLSNYEFECEFLEELQAEGHKVASEHENLPTDAFFFASDDDIYYYFRTNEKNNNPPVYRVSRRRPPMLFYHSFWHFLLDQMGAVEGAEGREW